MSTITKFPRKEGIKPSEESKLHKIELLNDELHSFNHAICAAYYLSQDDADLVVDWNQEIRHEVYDSLIRQLNDCLSVIKRNDDANFDDIPSIKMKPLNTRLEWML
jgi:hypothetical protein